MAAVVGTAAWTSAARAEGQAVPAAVEAEQPPAWSPLAERWVPSPLWMLPSARSALEVGRASTSPPPTLRSVQTSVQWGAFGMRLLGDLVERQPSEGGVDAADLFALTRVRSEQCLSTTQPSAPTASTSARSYRPCFSPQLGARTQTLSLRPRFYTEGSLGVLLSGSL